MVLLIQQTSNTEKNYEKMICSQLGGACEQEFIAENITKFDVVTGITVNEIEVRIHGKQGGGVGSSAIYRTNDIKAIYAHTYLQAVEAKKNVEKIRGRTANV